MPRPIRLLLLATVILATQATSSLPGQGFPPDKAVSQMTLANAAKTYDEDAFNQNRIVSKFSTLLRHFSLGETDNL